MFKYIAKAPCRFCGQPFAKVAEVPTELIEPTRISALMREGTLERMEAAETVETGTALEPEVQPDEPQVEKVKSSGRKRGTK